MSEYRIQVVNRAGVVVKSWSPGGPVEADMIEGLCQRIAANGMSDDLCRRISASGVGVFRTEAQVLEAVRAAFPAVVDGVREAYGAMLHELKAKV